MRLIRLGVIGLTLLCAAGAAQADHRFRAQGATERFGPDCKRLYRQTGQATLFVGSVLGGQNRAVRYGDGTQRDYRAFQACFLTADACESWTARHAALRPHPPGYVRCTPVYVGLTPPARAQWHWAQPAPVRARY